MRYWLQSKSCFVRRLWEMDRPADVVGIREKEEEVTVKQKPGVPVRNWKLEEKAQP